MRSSFIFYSLLFAASMEGAEIDVEGQEWGEISFRCAHRLASNNRKYFCKDPCKRDEDNLVSVSPGGRAESGRITLTDSGDGAFTVNFKHLQLSDSGGYFCAVDRFGADTYTSVHLSVHKAVSTTIEPVISSTRTYLNVTNSTLQPVGVETSKPTNLSTATNFTNEGQQNISAGTMGYATLGALAALAVLLLLAAQLRKCREKEECSASKDQNHVDCNRRDPPASSAERCIDIPIYENMSSFKGVAGATSPPADHLNNQDLTRIYIDPLPSAASDRKREEVVRKQKCKPKRHESTGSKASLRLSTSSRESTGRLWFGLDLSKTNHS